MLPTRPCRHAHTCGLTYCTVRTPARFSPLASDRLNSGASMPTKTSGRASRNRRATAARNRSRRGRWRSTSARPMTESCSAPHQASQPAAVIFGPAIPKHSRPGTRSRSAAISAAPSWSPECSPATKPTRRRCTPLGAARTAALIARGCAWRRG